MTNVDQDGISIICVILRHVDSESIDYDTLLYCYLKVRQTHTVWLRPVFWCLELYLLDFRSIRVVQWDVRMLTSW